MLILHCRGLLSVKYQGPFPYSWKLNDFTTCYFAAVNSVESLRKYPTLSFVTEFR